MAESKRLRGHRSIETLQNHRLALVQPWLDFANLSADPETLHRTFVQRFGVPIPARHPLETWAWRMTRFGTRTEPTRIEALLIELHNRIASIFDKFPAMRSSQEIDGNIEDDPDRWAERDAHIPAPPNNEFMGGNVNGRLEFHDDPLAKSFKEAIKGIELSRVRRCPVCRKFYYAMRDNKGACDEHLARARVERLRDPELKKKYEETRRINRLIKNGKGQVSIAKAKAAVKSTAKRRQRDGTKTRTE